MLYQERMRRVDDQMFTAFDFPDCGQVRAKRPVSTTPLQALNLMNSDFVVEQSKLIAERAKKNAAGDETKSIDRCFELLLGRTPDAEERQGLSRTGQSKRPAVRLSSLNQLQRICVPAMSNPEHLSPHGRRLLDRRSFLGTAGLSTAGLALASLLDADGLLADDARTVSGKARFVPTSIRTIRMRRGSRTSMPAKQVLVIYCPGAVSHVDTFDYKPALTKLHGQKPPGIPRSHLKDRPATLPSRFGISNRAAKREKWSPTCCRTWQRRSMTSASSMR